MRIPAAQSVEELFEKRLLPVRLLAMSIPLTVSLGWYVTLPIGVLLRRLLHRRRDRGLPWSGSFDDLVEFSPVQPDSPAVGTVIYLNPLTFRHDKVHCVADGTFH